MDMPNLPKSKEDLLNLPEAVKNLDNNETFLRCAQTVGKKESVALIFFWILGQLF